MESTEAEKLQLGREGDRVIAELLGWHLASNDRYWDSGHPPGSVFWIATPQDKRNSALGWDTAEQAWNDAAKWRIPHYTASVDAALTLLDDLRFTIQHAPDGLAAWYGTKCNVNIETGNLLIGQGQADTLALAICRAWLVWKARETRE